VNNPVYSIITTNKTEIKLKNQIIHIDHYADCFVLLLSDNRVKLIDPHGNTLSTLQVESTFEHTEKEHVLVSTKFAIVPRLKWSNRQNEKGGSSKGLFQIYILGDCLEKGKGKRKVFLMVVNHGMVSKSKVIIFEERKIFKTCE
jgi:hypothetical protein